jgi:hypothetical protein
LSGDLRLRLGCPCGGRLEWTQAPGEPGPGRVACGGCGEERTLEPGRRDEEGGLWACQVCGHPELYSRKDFPAALGLGIVGVAAVAAPSTAYLSLVGATLVDGLLYLFMPEVVACYVCGAEHRGAAKEPRHPRFDREIAERLKYGRRAVMGRPMREGGTANAPDPEH